MSELANIRADAQTLIARSQELSDVVRSILATSRALMARSAELCTFFRRISGSSDLEAPLLAEIIAMSPMCLDCLATKTDIPSDRVGEAMARIRGFMAVIVETGRCEACRQITTIHRLGERTAPGGAVADRRQTPAPPPMTHNQAIWRFLESRRGEMFCTRCIANALLATRRIDRAILGAEGRGARRVHGPCAGCGRGRLLCGLVS
jgi:hypothetical protein